MKHSMKIAVSLYVLLVISLGLTCYYISVLNNPFSDTLGPKSKIHDANQRSKVTDIPIIYKSGIAIRLVREPQATLYLRYSCSYRIRNIETDATMIYHKQSKGSPWINEIAKAESWISDREKGRMDIDKVDRPNTKWTFVRWISVEVKMIIDAQQLLMGAGKLPNWFRQKNGMYSVDTYDDYLCLFRCIAIQRGGRPDRCCEKARTLAREYLGHDNGPGSQGIPLDDIKKVEEHFKLGIRVYEPTADGVWYLMKVPANYDVVGGKTMTIGMFGGHTSTGAPDAVNASLLLGTTLDAVGVYTIDASGKRNRGHVAQFGNIIEAGNKIEAV